jgi:hypothetical protein
VAERSASHDGRPPRLLGPGLLEELAATRVRGERSAQESRMLAPWPNLFLPDTNAHRKNLKSRGSPGKPALPLTV